MMKPSHVIEHRPPLKRVEIGARTPLPAAVETESASAKTLREAAEQAQHIEHLRIWNHVVQTCGGGRGAMETPHA